MVLDVSENPYLIKSGHFSKIMIWMICFFLEVHHPSTCDEEKKSMSPATVNIWGGLFKRLLLIGCTLPSIWTLH